MPIDTLAQRLSLLLKDGHIPAGSLGRQHVRRMSPLFEAGILEYQRIGGGRRVVSNNLQALSAFVEKLYPGGLDGIDDTEALPRSKAVANFRDAKRALTSDVEPVLLRGFGNAVLRSGNNELPAAHLTSIAGVTAMSLNDAPFWSFNGCAAIIENQEMFMHIERLGLPCGIALYAGGRLSRRVLKWLGSSVMQNCRYIHCGDYDPVGLDEYLRLATECPDRVELYIPSNLEDHFIHHGKSDLIKNSSEILSRLRKNQDPAIKKVVDLIDRYGVGVEQEILLSTFP